MTGNVSLKQYLDLWIETHAGRVDIAETVQCIAIAATKLARIIARHAITPVADGPNNENPDGETQSPLDICAHKLFKDALVNTRAGLFASEESEEALLLNQDMSLGVAIDPLDGSSNIDINLPVGTLFSIFSFDQKDIPLTKHSFQNATGTDQVAAGFFVFGPQTKLVLTLRKGTQIFSMNPQTSEFLLVHENIQIPESQREFAINAANYRFWDDSIRGYIDDCIAGDSGPRGENFNMRWIASLVAEAYRILIRGGIFLDPRDLRPGYENGRLRLLYEAFPIALLIEQAGGAATDGEIRILDKMISDLHGRVPLIFGSTEKVERVARYYAKPPIHKHRYALFESRNLLRN